MAEVKRIQLNRDEIAVRIFVSLCGKGHADAYAVRTAVELTDLLIKELEKEKDKPCN